MSRQTEDNIRILEGLEAVRMRPGMYVGGTDVRALHHLIYEAVDNAIDEALAGRCDRIQVTLNADGSVSVADNGGGIPVGIHKQTGLSTLEVVMTRLHAGGKFDESAYKVSGGLHGVGISATNALSDWMIAEVWRDGKVYRQRYQRGITQTEVEFVRDMEPDEPTGTRQTFKPDPTIMEVTEFSFTTLVQRFREMAFVTRGVTITLRDDRVKPIPREMTFYFEGGLRSFVRYLNRNRKPIHDPVYAEREVEIEFEENGHKPYTVGVEIGFQYTNASTTTELYFANTIHTPDGGSHQAGLRAAITRTINLYARKAGLLKEKDPNFSSNDTLEGLTAIVSVKHPNPQFESQTKVKLMNPEVQGAVSQVTSDAFAEYLEVNARDAKRIVEQCMTSMRARDAAKKARELVRRGANLLENTTLPGKLADCSEQDPRNSELYIVEGDSAGGCFSGDTRIALADGRNLSFEELVAEQAAGQDHFCYTIRHDGTIGLGRALHARVTKRDVEVIRVTLDNGEVITCTPDHRFMLRDGSYKAAVDLTPDDSLMPLYPEMLETDTPVVMSSEQHAREAVAHYNHRILAIERVQEHMDVYDIEVPNTHNFALTSGVFVHNSAKQGRDRHFQAILPLRGKILNTERARLNKILDNNEVKALISALGVGIGDDFNLDGLRYGRVIIMTDADVDGAHIRTLLLTFFFRYMTPLITSGHLYIAQPPLYLIKMGKQKQYAYTEHDREQIFKQLKNPERVSLQRYKGLGEMNPDQLWETTMDPGNRTLLQVTIEDAAEADRVFDMLMGSSVPPRRRFITTHAKKATLDV
ncbi:MAG: DNA topoisomerase (ATP-hydrolyzing) subunit B [Anaerolineae bacterium]|nr:DNA topoisomerase (ATP-hydrolyzing) subunit B [Anaerolineae bacterium]